MMLILNCGSQSVKWALYNQKMERIKEGEKRVSDVKKYKSILLKELSGLRDYKREIKKVGHRFVHGAEKFREPLKVTGRTIKDLEKLSFLAPLHNPYNLLGIKVGQKEFPDAGQFAVFDTGFYKDLLKVSKTYPLPEKFGFQKFGFHGISHEYAAREASKRDFKKLRIITCHLGGGSSVTAIKKGKAVDTSMGFTPLGGVVMMTRPGDLDPGTVLEIAKKVGLKKTREVLNRQSGIKGVSGEEDMLRLLEKIKKGSRKAKLALEIFVYSIQKHIGAYYALMGGCDLLVFTGTIGWGSAKIRRKISNISILKDTKVMKIKPNEEWAIANKIKNI